MADIMVLIAAVEWMVLGLLVLWKLKGWNHFNPRTPRGVRPFAIGQRIILT